MPAGFNYVSGDWKDTLIARTHSSWIEQTVAAPIGSSTASVVIWRLKTPTICTLSPKPYEFRRTLERAAGASQVSPIVT